MPRRLISDRQYISDISRVAVSSGILKDLVKLTYRLANIVKPRMIRGAHVFAFPAPFDNQRGQAIDLCRI